MEVLPLSLPALLTESGARPRTPGLHLTDILDYLERVMGSPRREWGEEWAESSTLGFLWEDAIRRALDIQEVGELQKDGILLSPDGVEDDPDLGTVLWEFKLTWKSLSKNPPESRWRWLTQVKSYCYALGSHDCKLVAWYQCGNYRPPAPVLVPRHFRFTQQELVDNWAMVLSGARDLIKKGWKPG